MMLLAVPGHCPPAGRRRRAHRLGGVPGTTVTRRNCQWLPLRLPLPLALAMSAPVRLPLALPVAASGSGTHTQPGPFKLILNSLAGFKLNST